MPNRKPNILWILADQMRAQATGYAGDPNVHTPNLDRLAVEGVNFTHAVSGTPLCSPYRGSLITGKYPHRSSVPGLNSPLDPSMPTIAHALRDHGYRTCWIGKWHLDGNRKELDLTLPENRKEIRKIPPERRGGFENWWAYENNNQPFNCWVHTEAPGGTTESFRLPGYETDVLTDILLQWIEQSVKEEHDQPFFAVLSVQPPHDPYVAPAECMDRHIPGRTVLRSNVPPLESIASRARRELAGYYAAVERLDWNIGKIRDTLHKLGLDQNTYIVFFSDHGDMHGSHGQFRKQAPWEESIRIPFLVGGPTRKSYKTLEYDFPVNHVDVAPTTLGLCGISKPGWMDGTDYSPFILEKSELPAVPDSAYLSLPIPTAFSTNLIPEESVDRPFRGIVTRDGWKYIVLEGQPWLMFNVNEDPYEFVNLAHNAFYKEKRKELQNRLLLWIEETEDSFPLPEL